MKKHGCFLVIHAVHHFRRTRLNIENVSLIRVLRPQAEAQLDRHCREERQVKFFQETFKTIMQNLNLEYQKMIDVSYARGSLIKMLLKTLLQDVYFQSKEVVSR